MIRKQTLTNVKRYVTQELKEYELKISVRKKILALEEKIFNELIVSMLDYIKPIQLNAQLMARLDVLLSFSRIAIEHNYVKPEINESFVIDIKNGRHPVIETQLPLGEKYVANDMYLDNEKQQIIIITGPNMSGKIGFTTSNGLNRLTAQIGSFVPRSSKNRYC